MEHSVFNDGLLLFHRYGKLARYWPKIAVFFLHHVHFNTPLETTLLLFSQDLRREKSTTYSLYRPSLVMLMLWYVRRRRKHTSTRRRRRIPCVVVEKITRRRREDGGFVVDKNVKSRQTFNRNSSDILTSGVNANTTLEGTRKASRNSCKE